MLRIRFSRTGKVGQPSFRIVVAERTAPVKGKFIDHLGYYLPARNPKVISIDKEKVSYWIGKGAIPTDSIASLLKKEGMPDMDHYLEPRNKKRKKKSDSVSAKAEANKPAESVATTATVS